MRSEQAVPAVPSWEGRGAGLLPSFPSQFSPGKGDLKLRWKVEGEDAPKSRGRGRKVRKSEGAVGIWDGTKSVDGGGCPGILCFSRAGKSRRVPSETNI